MTSKSISRRQALQGLAGAAALGMSHTRAFAASDFPSGPVTMIVPYGAGGTTDLFLRQLAVLTEKELKQTIVIDNRPGAGGAMGALMLADETKSDGYKISQAPEGILRLPYLEKVSFDLENNYSYICGIAGYNFGIAVRKDSPFKSFEDFIEAGKAKPGEITYSAGLANTTMPLMMARVTQLTGATFLHTPFKNGTEMINAVLGGHVDAVLDSNGGMVGQIDSGELRLLATFGESRSLRWPDIPTIKDLGIDATGVMYFGMIAAKGLEQGRLDILHQAFRKAMEQPAFADLCRNMDMLPWYKPPAEFRAFMINRYAEYGKILEEAGLRRY